MHRRRRMSALSQGCIVATILLCTALDKSRCEPPDPGRRVSKAPTVAPQPNPSALPVARYTFPTARATDSGDKKRFATAICFTADMRCVLAALDGDNVL